MMKLFDVCRIYKCKTDGGIGYIAEIGESVRIVCLKSILTKFEYGLLKTKSEEKALLLLKKAYSEINKLNSDNLIDTQNREMLFEYFSNRLSRSGFNSVTDKCEKYRDW